MMQFSHPRHDVHVPDSVDPRDALIRTTHLAIAAHQDDIEIMAYHGIAECFESKDKWFSGVVVTNGAGSPRAGAFAQYTDEQMQDIRRREQRKAADLGKYSIQLQLAHPSGAVKDPARNDVRADLRKILEIALPKVVYLHNPADKHDTHVAVFLRSIEALRSIPHAERPEKVYGCEVWRDLDWLLAEDKRALAVNAKPELAAALLEVFESQIAGGKRYDLAAVGRRLANATFNESHATDAVNALTWVMDLTPLLVDDSLDPIAYTLAHLDRLKADVAQRLQRFS